MPENVYCPLCFSKPYPSLRPKPPLLSGKSLLFPAGGHLLLKTHNICVSLTSVHFPVTCFSLEPSMII